MSTGQLRKQITEQLKSLSEDRLRAAHHFIAYLYEHEDNPATAELLKIEGFRSSLRRAEQQAASGKTILFSKVRRNV